MSNVSQEQRQDGPTATASKASGGTSGAPSSGAATGRVQLKQSLAGKGFDEQAALLSPEGPVQRKDGEPASGEAKLRSEIAEAAKQGGDDDYVRDTIGPAHLKIASAFEKASMITNLLRGDTGDEDEAKILQILESSNGLDVLREVARMGNSEWLVDDVNGAEGDQLKLLMDRLQKDEVKLGELKKQRAAAAAAPVEAKAPEAAAQVAPVEAQKDVKEQVKEGDAKAGPKPITDPNDPAMSDARKKMIYEGERRMGSRPSGYSKDGKTYVGAAPKNEHGKNATNLFDGATKTKEGATSCGLLPGVLMRQFAILKTPKTEKITKWLTSNGKAQDGLEKFGLEFGCWTYQSGTNRPQPGDIIVTNFPTNDEFAHVCVAHTISERTWVTMDSGQGHELGDSAAKVTKNILTEDERKEKKLGPGLYQGNSGDVVGGGTTLRKVHGWVDIDKLVAYAGAK
jgi:hypothetical protein